MTKKAIDLLNPLRRFNADMDLKKSKLIDRTVWHLENKVRTVDTGDTQLSFKYTLNYSSDTRLMFSGIRIFGGMVFVVGVRRYSVSSMLDNDMLPKPDTPVTYSLKSLRDNLTSSEIHNLLINVAEVIDDKVLNKNKK